MCEIVPLHRRDTPVVEKTTTRERPGRRHSVSLRGKRPFSAYLHSGTTTAAGAETGP
jgi:hypothetical protein